MDPIYDQYLWETNDSFGHPEIILWSRSSDELACHDLIQTNSVFDVFSVKTLTRPFTQLFLILLMEKIKVTHVFIRMLVCVTDGNIPQLYVWWEV